jgi:cytoskeleton protein RodZ
VLTWPGSDPYSLKITVVCVILSENEAMLAGEILKNKREDLGLEIHEIAESLKISEEYLAAIENDAFEKLPVPVYTMGYIRSYAAFVGINADAIIQYYREHLSQPQPSTIVPIAFSQKKGPRIGYLIAVLGVVLVAFLLFPHVPKEKSAEFPPVRPATEKAPDGAPDGPGGSQTDAAQHVRAGGSAVSAGAADSSGKAAVSAADQHNLSVTADDTTWISVTFDNGKREEMLLRPGQSKNWPFSGKAFLKVGNAGGINIRLDGTDLGKPGSPGQVKIIALPPAEAGK